MNSNKIIIVLLVILCAIFAYQTFFQKTFANVEKAYAADGSSNTEIITVPFYVNSSEQKIAVFKKDTVMYKGNKLANQWCMTIYGMRDGRKLRLEASRWIENDFFLKNFNIYERRDGFGDPDWLYEVRRKGEGLNIEPKEEKKEEPKKDDTEKPEVAAPDWFVKPPAEPNVAIYTLAMMTISELNELQIAKAATAASARKEISKTLETNINEVAKKYVDKMQVPAEKEKFEALTNDIVKQIKDTNNYSAKHMKNEIKTKDGNFILFALLRLDFDPIAKIFSDASMKEFESISDEAKEAFDEMKKVAVAMTEKAFVTQSAKPYLPASSETSKPE